MTALPRGPKGPTAVLPPLEPEADAPPPPLPPPGDNAPPNAAPAPGAPADETAAMDALPLEAPPLPAELPPLLDADPVVTAEDPPLVIDEDAPLVTDGDPPVVGGALTFAEVVSGPLLVPVGGLSVTPLLEGDPPLVSRFVPEPPDDEELGVLL